MSFLASPLALQGMRLDHRVVMSAMTRLRNDPISESPRELNALYYEQRTSSGGLIITECTHISRKGRGYVRAPGLYTKEQIDGWKLVTSRVHQMGGRIICQLFHPGRISHSSLLPPGEHPISASAVQPAGQLYVEGGVKAPYEIPQEATLSQIGEVVKDFATSARTAVQECGFDGVELHAGNGYLLQQFMAKKTNQRPDQYGGAVANRCRLLLDTIDACVEEVGAAKVAVKLQPGVTFSDLVEPEEDVQEVLTHLAPELEQRKLLYVCLSSLNGMPYFQFVGLPQPNLSFDPFKYFRTAGFQTSPLMINGGLSIEDSEAYLQEGVADLASFGTLFIANANLPALIKSGRGTKELSMGGADVKVWYSKDPTKDKEGYVDWPLVEAKA